MDSLHLEVLCLKIGLRVDKRPVGGLSEDFLSEPHQRVIPHTPHYSVEQALEKVLHKPLPGPKKGLQVISQPGITPRQIYQHTSASFFLGIILYEADTHDLI